MSRKCPVCGRKIREGEGVQDLVVTNIYTRGVLYSVRHGVKVFCSERCRDEWNRLMKEKIKRLERRLLFWLVVFPLGTVAFIVLLLLLTLGLGF